VCHGLKQEASSILVSHVLPVGTAAMISKWLGGPSYALLFHGLDARLIKKSPWKTFLTKMIVKQSSAIFTNSFATEREVRSLAGAHRNIQVVTPGVDPFETLNHEDARIRLGIHEDESVILAVGRLVNRKGFDMLIRSMSHLPKIDKIRVVIIGDGPEEGDLRMLATESPHPVQFISRASDTYLMEWYAAADVFCLPVKDDPKDWEGFGIVFLEAMGAGIPSIGCFETGAAEIIVDGETGFLVPPRDLKALTGALRTLLQDSALRQRMGASALSRAKLFSWRTNVDRYLSLFKECGV
jgi:phosphatidylinositol alpha-1,6-mannosyltransferase